jgi:hypothetical protein
LDRSACMKCVGDKVLGSNAWIKCLDKVLGSSSWMKGSENVFIKCLDKVLGKSAWSYLDACTNSVSHRNTLVRCLYKAL